MLKIKIKQKLIPVLTVGLMSFFYAFPLAASQDFSYFNTKDNANITVSLDKETNYNIEKKETTITILFSKPIADKFKQISLSPMGLITHVNVSDDNLKVMLKLSAPNVEVKNYTNQDRLIIEFKKNISAPQAAQTNIPETIKQQLSDSLIQSTQNVNQEQVASLSFSWNIAVGAASFMRDDYLWLIFDHPKSIDLDEIRKLGGQLVKDVIQIPHSQATVLRFSVPKNTKSAMRQEGLLWIMDLYVNDLSPDVNELPLITRRNPQNKKFLFAPTNNAGNIVSIIDPEVGDNIIAAPLNELGYGINQAYSYPDVDILSSGQGLAIVPNTSDIWMIRGNTGLIIRAINRSLNITENLDSIKRNEEFRKNTDDESSFNLRISSQLLNEKFNKAESQLIADIASAEPQQKNKAQMELAKYYIAKGLGTNALNTLNNLKNSGAPETKTENFHALLGVANFLNRRYEEAVENFSFGKLPEQNEAVFWRALASAANEFNKENNVIIMSFISLIKNYPQELQERIALIGTQTAIDSNDDISAQNFLDILKSSNGNDYRKANIAFLNAQKFELQGYPRNAIREYKSIENSISQKYSSLARFNKTILEDKLNLVSPSKVISEFERLRYAWGETPFKIRLLDTLARAYIKNKDYYNALRTYKELLPITPNQAEVINKMVKTFEDIYINNMADSMTPLKSLALYDDFSWLAPKSNRYSEIAQKLADRLVSVDLLDRASELLYDQLKNRSLPELQKHKIGARLALIRLFENKNQEALGILEATEMENAPESIRHHRNIIKAKALANIGENEQALELLKNDNSQNAILLRSEIYWNADMWNEASDNIKYLIEKPQPEKPLSEEQIGYILDWATALKKSGKETVIIRLRNQFLPYFENTPYYSTFNILTNTLEKDTIDINNINDIVNNVAAFSNFAKIYNKNLKEGNLSQTVN